MSVARTEWLETYRLTRADLLRAMERGEPIPRELRLCYLTEAEMTAAGYSPDRGWWRKESRP